MNVVGGYNPYWPWGGGIIVVIVSIASEMKPFAQQA